MDARDSPGAGAARTLRLEVVSGNAAGDVIEVEDELVIGRQATGIGTLANDVEISRSHARIRRGPADQFLLEDLGSTNGTYLNGSLVEGPAALEAGDRIEMGATALVVHAGDVQAGPTVSRNAAPSGSPEPPPEQTAVEAAPGPAAAVTPFTLRIEVDPAAGSATVALDEGSDEVRLVHEDGRWRLVSSS